MFAGMAEHGDFVHKLTSIMSAIASPQLARAGSEQLNELLLQQPSQPCLILADDSKLLQSLSDGISNCLQSSDIRTVQLTTDCIEIMLKPTPATRTSSEQRAVEERFKQAIRALLQTQIITSTAKATLKWLTPSVGASVHGPGHQRAGTCSCMKALTELLVAHEENNSHDEGIAPVVLDADTAAELSKALLQELGVQAGQLQKELQLLQLSGAQLQLLPFDEQLFRPWKNNRQEHCALLLDLLRQLAMMVTQTTLLLMPPSWGSSLPNPPAAAPPPPAAAGQSSGSAHASAAAERHMALLLQLAAPGPLAGEAHNILSSCLLDLPADSVPSAVTRLLRDCPHLVRWLAEGLRPPQLRDTCRQPSKYKGMSPADARKQVNEARQFKIAELLGSIKLVDTLLSKAWREVRQGPAAWDSSDSSSTTSGSSSDTAPEDDVAAGSRERPVRLSPLAAVALSPPHWLPDPAVHPNANSRLAEMHAAPGGSRDGLQHAAAAVQRNGHHILVKQEPQQEPQPGVAAPDLQPGVVIPELAQALLEWQVPERLAALHEWADAERAFTGAGAREVNGAMKQLKEVCGTCLDAIWAAGLPEPRPLRGPLLQQEAGAQRGAQAVSGSGDAPAMGRKRAAWQRRQGPSKTKKGRGSGAGRDVPAEGDQRNAGDAAGAGQHTVQVRALPCISQRPVMAGTSSTGRAGLQDSAGGRGRGTGHGRTTMKGKSRRESTAGPQMAVAAVGQPLLGIPLLAGEPSPSEQRNSYPGTSDDQQGLQGLHPTLHELARAAASRDAGEVQRLQAQQASAAAAALEEAGYAAAEELQLAVQDQQEHGSGDQGIPEDTGHASADGVQWEQGPSAPWAAEAGAQQPGSFPGSPDGAGPSQPAGTAGAGISGSGTGGHTR
jgi:hypothetical protein